MSAPTPPSRRKLGVTSLGKGDHQNFASLPFQNYEVTLIRNGISVVEFFNERLWNRLGFGLPRWLNKIYVRSPGTDCGIVHLYNMTSFSATPWLTTFEVRLPMPHIGSRWALHACFRRLRSKSCRKLIAMSAAAYHEQIRFTQEQSEGVDEIREKMCVLHPVQPVLVETYEKKRRDSDHIVFTIVGDDFFRKGGEETLRVFEHFLQKGHPIRLNVISMMESHHKPFLSADREGSMRIIYAYPHAIRHRAGLPHGEVLSILNETDVELLPTYSDTYGFSVLEAQASGCPVITTNVRALPEVNNQEIGWLISVPKDEHEDALFWDPEGKRRSSRAIEEGLMQTIAEILADPGSIRRKGQGALERIRRDHDPAKRAMELEAIYDGIVTTSY
jgi:hypothetical protein